MKAGRQRLGISTEFSMGPELGLFFYGKMSMVVSIGGLQPAAHPMEVGTVAEVYKPIGSRYGIFTYIYHQNQPNVGKYTIHGSYGK